MNTSVLPSRTREKLGGGGKPSPQCEHICHYAHCSFVAFTFNGTTNIM